MINISKKDIGRRVVFRNGKKGLIVYVNNALIYSVEVSLDNDEGTVYITYDGKHVFGYSSIEDMKAFLKPKNKPEIKIKYRKAYGFMDYNGELYSKVYKSKVLAKEVEKKLINVRLVKILIPTRSK